MRACLIDLDGTICSIEHRTHFLDQNPKNWTSFHDALVDDPENTAVAWLAKTLFFASTCISGKDEFSILIVTARHEPYRERTEKWLEDHQIRYDRLYMRADNDHRPDDKVKEDILQTIIEDGYEPILAIDDRPSIAAMWRSYGITCLQCAPDNEITRANGKVCLTLLIGPAGCGKSTFAEANYRKSEIISSDQIREDEGLGHDPSDLAQTFRIARAIAKARIDNGLHAVIDATNLKIKDRLSFVDLVPKGGLVNYVLLDRSYDDKITTRGWRPVELIDRHHKTFRDTTLPDMKNADGRGNIVIIDKRQHRI